MTRAGRLDKESLSSRRSLALVLLPDRWLTHDALIEAARVYLRCSGDWRPGQGKDEGGNVRYWVPCAEPQPGDGLPIFLHPEGEMVCKIRTRGGKNGAVL